MRFTPNHMVSYHGNFYDAGKTFEIDPVDAEEMQRYGIVDREPEQAEETHPKRGKKKE